MCLRRRDDGAPPPPPPPATDWVWDSSSGGGDRAPKTPPPPPEIVAVAGDDEAEAAAACNIAPLAIGPRSTDDMGSVAFNGGPPLACSCNSTACEWSTPTPPPASLTLPPQPRIIRRLAATDEVTVADGEDAVVDVVVSATGALPAELHAAAFVFVPDIVFRTDRIRRAP